MENIVVACFFFDSHCTYRHTDTFIAILRSLIDGEVKMSVHCMCYGYIVQRSAYVWASWRLQGASRCRQSANLSWPQQTFRQPASCRCRLVSVKSTVQRQRWQSRTRRRHRRPLCSHLSLECCWAAVSCNTEPRNISFISHCQVVQNTDAQKALHTKHRVQLDVLKSICIKEKRTPLSPRRPLIGSSRDFTHEHGK